MSLSPEVTIYIPSKNYGQFLEEAIASVFVQTFSNWELHLIDDGSDDDSIDIMRRFEFDPRVKVSQLSGVGLPRVANYALDKACGEFIIRLDGDDFLSPFALEVLVSTLRRNPELELVFPDYFEVDDDGRRLYLRTSGDSPTRQHYRMNPPHGACTMWRIKSLKEIGGYTVENSAQDGLSVWLKVHKRETFAHVPLPLFFYRMHGNNLTSSKYLIRKARHQVKLSAVQKQNELPRVTAVIPCRSNFDFIPALWKQELGGMNLLESSITACSQSPLVSQIKVLVDSKELEDFVYSFSRKIDKPVECWFRSVEETMETTTLVEVLQKYVTDDSFSKDEIILLKYIQAPFVSHREITEIVSTLILEESPSATLVSQLHGTILRKDRFGLNVVQERSFISDINDTFYSFSNTVLATRVGNILKSSMWGSVSAYVVADRASVFVLEDMFSLMVAEKIQEKLNEGYA